MCAAEDLEASDQRVFIIDGLNLAYWCGSPPALRIPLSLLASLLEAGHAARAIFDASARYQLRAELGCYEQLLNCSQLAIEVPSGQPADRELIKQARACGGAIISRDKFRDHRKKFRKLIDDPERLLSGRVFNELLELPALGPGVPLEPSANKALARVQDAVDARE